MSKPLPVYVTRGTVKAAFSERYYQTNLEERLFRIERVLDRIAKKCDRCNDFNGDIREHFSITVTPCLGRHNVSLCVCCVAASLGDDCADIPDFIFQKHVKYGYCWTEAFAKFLRQHDGLFELALEAYDGTEVPALLMAAARHDHGRITDSGIKAAQKFLDETKEGAA